MEASDAMDVTATEDTLTVEISDGRTISVPLVWYPRLVHATSQERSNWELQAAGQHIHWPDLDEDLSVEGLLAGRKSGEGRKSLERWLEARKEDRSVALHDIATQDFTRSNELNPNAAQSYIMRAVAFQLQGNYNSALQDFNKVLELDPSNPLAYFNRGLSKLSTEDWANAAFDLSQAQSLGLDIVSVFVGQFESVGDFERKYSIELPEYIKAMLTPKQ